MWEATFHKNNTHRIQEYQSFANELNEHVAKIAETYKEFRQTTMIAGDFNATVSQDEHNYTEEELYSPGRNQPFLTKLLDKHKMFSAKEEEQRSSKPTPI